MEHLPTELIDKYKEGASPGHVPILGKRLSSQKEESIDSAEREL
jgi:hypothetical protein